MNKLLAATIISAMFIAPAFAEESPSMADIMHSSPDIMSPGQMHGQEPADEEGDCDSAEHGMGGQAMMGMNGDYGRHGYGMGRMGEHEGFGRGGRGYGMMGPGAEMMMEPNMHRLEALGLSEEQQAKITPLADKLKHDNWATQGLINDETAKLRDLYEADKRDPVVIDKEYKKIFDLKRKMIETYLEAQNRIEAVLTPEQRTQMRSARHHMRGMYGRHMQ